MSHSAHGEVGLLRKSVDYWTDHIEIEKNDWLFTYDNLTQSISRKDDLPRCEELRMYENMFRYFYHIYKHLVLKLKGPNGQYREDALPRAFVFYAMLYTHRYFQRESLKTTDHKEVSTVIAFITARVLECHRKIEDLLSFHLSYFFKDTTGSISPKYWTLKERLESLELKVMARLCFDFIIPVPYLLVNEFIRTEEIYYLDQNLDQSSADKLGRITTSHFENAAKTQIFLLYKIEEILLFLFAYVCANQQYQLSDKFYEKVGFADSFDLSKALKFYHHLSELNDELAKANPKSIAVERLEITEERLRNIIKDADVSLQSEPQQQKMEIVKPNEKKNVEIKPEIKSEIYYKEKDDFYGRTSGSSRPATPWVYDEESKSDYKPDSYTPYKFTYSRKDESITQPILTPNFSRTPVHPSKTPTHTPKTHAATPNTTASSKSLDTLNSHVIFSSKSVHSPIRAEYEHLKIYNNSEHGVAHITRDHQFSLINKNLTSGGVDENKGASESQMEKNHVSIGFKDSTMDNIKKTYVVKDSGMAMKGEDVKVDYERVDLANNSESKDGFKTSVKIGAKKRDKIVEKKLEKKDEKEELPAHLIVHIKEETHIEMKDADLDESFCKVKEEEMNKISKKSDSVRITAESEHNETKNEQVSIKLDTEKKKEEENVKFSGEAKIEKPQLKRKLSKSFDSQSSDISTVSNVGIAVPITNKNYLAGKLRNSTSVSTSPARINDNRSASGGLEPHLPSKMTKVNDSCNLVANKKTCPLIISTKNAPKESNGTQTKDIKEVSSKTAIAVTVESTLRSKKSIKTIKKETEIINDKTAETQPSRPKTSSVSSDKSSNKFKIMITQLEKPESTRTPKSKAKAGFPTLRKKSTSKKSSKLLITLGLADIEKLDKINGYISDDLSDVD